ncbi:MAG TPA: hypothetical protein VG406_03735 [Isosphaeraceae bacterium]|jgi:hypothetical protein|nr:hypothetical protein [Isosphaeraceae bacterium]
MSNGIGGLAAAQSPPPTPVGGGLPKWATTAIGAVLGAVLGALGPRAATAPARPGDRPRSAPAVAVEVATPAASRPAPPPAAAEAPGPRTVADGLGTYLDAIDRAAAAMPTRTTP